MERDVLVHIVPWGAGDLPLLTLLLGDPAMTQHLGGPESPSKLAERQRRFERLVDPAKGGMFKIIDDETGVGVGSVGYWEREWRDTQVYETGWMVIPAFQGRGIASMAVALAVEEARSQRAHRFLHAFPAIGQRTLERDLQEGRVHPAGGVRVRVPTGQPHAMQRLEARPVRP